MDMEARAHSEHPEALRLWLRLLTCAQIVEKKVRSQLREQFETTLPRFAAEESPDCRPFDGRGLEVTPPVREDNGANRDARSRKATGLLGRYPKEQPPGRPGG